MPGSSVYGIFQAKRLEWVVISFSRGLPDPGIEPASPESPIWQVDSLPPCHLGVKVKVAQLCPTLCDPMEHTVHGILQARILEWVAFPFSRGSSQPRDEPTSPAMQADSLPTSYQESPREGLKKHSFDYTDLLAKLYLCFFNTLSRFVVALLPGSKYLLISWLRSLSTVILEPKEIKSVAAAAFSCSLLMFINGLKLCSSCDLSVPPAFLLAL